MTSARKAIQRFLPAYMWAVSLAGAAFLFALLSDLSSQPFGGVVLFIVLAFATEMLHLDLPRVRGTTSVSFGVLFASILLFPPGVAALIAAVGTLRPRDLAGKVPLAIVLFNRGQLVLAAGLAGMVYEAAGATAVNPFALPQILFVLASGLTFYIVNMAAVALYFKFKDGTPFFQGFARNLRWIAPHLIALIPIGALLAVVYRNVGWAGAMLFFVPLLVARYSMQRYTDLRTLHMASIRALVRAIDARDHYTKGHSERVALLAGALGRQLKMRDEDLERIEFAGLLHDIGKIGISDEILLKPTALTAEEYQIMKSHPSVGAEIVSEIPRALGRPTPPVDETLVQWIRWHHERPDGKGYPDGLSTDAIPRGASILGVADALDAMMTDRPYKRGLTLAEAGTEVRRHSGTQFHPEVVAALEQAVAAGTFPTEEQLRAITGEPVPAAQVAPQAVVARDAAATAPAATVPGAQPVAWAGAAVDRPVAKTGEQKPGGRRRKAAAPRAARGTPSRAEPGTASRSARGTSARAGKDLAGRTAGMG